MSYLFGGGGGTSLPALTDNGTQVVSTEPIQLPAGAKNATAIQFTADGATSGWYRAAANNYVLSFGNNGYYSWDTGGFLLGNSTSIKFGSGDLTGTATDTFLGRRAAANFRFGAADVNGVPVAQTISVQNAITGSDLAGSTFTIDAPLGTGLGAGAKTVLNRGLMRATGGTAQVSANAFAICESKTLSNTSATTTALATIALASNSGGGAFGIITVVATDGTNFDTDSQSFNVSFVNKAGAITISTAQITTASPASNSGSTTCGITVTSGASLININVTPVFTTIVPTTVTAYLQLFSNGAGAITAL